MQATITIDQTTKPAGVAGDSREDLDTALLITCSNASIEGSYLWTLVDVPIRSALVRGTTGAAATFTFTPDVKGTYLVSLRVNGSPLQVDNDQKFGAVVTFGAKSLGWRYLAAREDEGDDNILKPGLSFPGDLNIRGWATERDVQLEQTELAAYEVLNRVLISPGLAADTMVQLDPATGKLHASVVPASPGSSNPSNFTAGTNAEVTALGIPTLLGGFKVDGDDLAAGRTFSLLFLGHYAANGGAGEAKLQLYDMGAVADGAQAGILRSEVGIPAPTGNKLYAVSQLLTASAAPGIDADEIHDTPRKYEVRMLLDSVELGDTMSVLWGGVLAE